MFPVVDRTKKGNSTLLRRGQEAIEVSAGADLFFRSRIEHFRRRTWTTKLHEQSCKTESIQE